MTSSVCNAPPRVVVVTTPSSHNTRHTIAMVNNIASSASCAMQGAYRSAMRELIVRYAQFVVSAFRRTSRPHVTSAFRRHGSGDERQRLLDVRRVMAAMPRVHGDRLVDRHASPVWMHE